MPTAVKMQAEYGDDLNVVFVESQGHTMADVQRLALKKKWFGTSAMWTKERPLNTGARGIPNFVLLSATGEVLLKGNPIRMHKQIEEQIAKFRKSRGKAPKSLPKQLHKAFKNLAKHKYAAALAEADRALAGAAEKPELQAAAKGFVARIESAVEAVLARIGRAIAEGYVEFAETLSKDLLKGVKGSRLAAKAEAVPARFAEQGLVVEAKAERALLKIERRLYAKGATPKTRKQLAKMAIKYGGTKAGTRAGELAKALD